MLVAIDALDGGITSIYITATTSWLFNHRVFTMVADNGQLPSSSYTTTIR